MSWIWTTQALVCCARLSHSVVSHYMRPNGSIHLAHHPPLSMGMLQTRIQEWIAMPSSRGSSQLRNWRERPEARSHTPGHRVLFRDNLVAQTGIPNILSAKYLLLALWRCPWDHLWTSCCPVSKQNWEWSPDKKVEPWLCFTCYIPSHLKICLGLG